VFEPSDDGIVTGFDLFELVSIADFALFHTTLTGRAADRITVLISHRDRRTKASV
jgi:hypothetical protein